MRHIQYILITLCLLGVVGCAGCPQQAPVTDRFISSFIRVDMPDGRIRYGYIDCNESLCRVIVKE